MSAARVLLWQVRCHLQAGQGETAAMNAETAQRPGGFGDTSRRSRRRGTQAGAAVLATVAVAGLLAATADARPPSGGNTVFVHSAGSGQLSRGGGVFRGVGGGGGR